jgi:hypothetical protein
MSIENIVVKQLNSKFVSNNEVDKTAFELESAFKEKLKNASVENYSFENYSEIVKRLKFNLFMKAITYS